MTLLRRLILETIEMGVREMHPRHPITVATFSSPSNSFECIFRVQLTATEAAECLRKFEAKFGLSGGEFTNFTAVEKDRSRVLYKFMWPAMDPKYILLKTPQFVEEYVLTESIMADHSYLAQRRRQGYDRCQLHVEWERRQEEPSAEVKASQLLSAEYEAFLQLNNVKASRRQLILFLESKGWLTVKAAATLVGVNYAQLHEKTFVHGRIKFLQFEGKNYVSLEGALKYKEGRQKYLAAIA